MNLAPISISTYSRIWHLKQTIESLQKNKLAQESILYIFSDAPKEGDEEIVKKLREYIHTIDGFKEVKIVEQKENNIKKNMHDARTIPLKEFGKMIRMEDDNIVSTSFLQFMNNGLDFYKDNKKIIAISGYNVPAKFPESYKHDYYKSESFNGWGFATWEDRGFLDIIEYNGQYSELMKDKKLYKKIKEKRPTLISPLKRIYEGTLNAGDYKITFHMIKNNLYTIKPIRSLVDNIGHDGSGVHCGINTKYTNEILNNRIIKFENNIKYNPEIDMIWRKHMEQKQSIIKRILNKIRKTKRN